VSQASIADLLEHTGRELAATDARVYRRVATHLERSSSALQDLQAPEAPAATALLLGKGSFHKQSLATLKALCREQGLKGTSRLKKAELADLLERQGVEPPPPPLESFSKAELIALVRQLLQRSG
jgi:hypothetical protein